MISYRQADLLNTFKQPMVSVSMDIDIPADPNQPGRALRNSDGRMKAVLVLKDFPRDKWEHIQGAVELALGQRLRDAIYSDPNEKFYDFVEGVKDKVTAAIRSISAGPVDLKITQDKVCTWHLRFNLRLK